MKLFDKALEMAKPIQDLAEGLRSCAEQMKSLSATVLQIARNQAIHHTMIMKVWNDQQLINTKMKSGSIDANMPDLHKPKGTDKSN